ncbi:Serine--pyruvate aminotransferase [Monoraphidium neglectum]|uniref:alanine--glyoxylate transaminase n=1 Tax=Monoraphidium neglectum TaxID=145388 RepID=A0A0D2MGF7_9CHLO|nr:Serine--pyruvate aminotransferase [Monoraphidium neglectum]KIY99826.1 Serine--pyruvate aminotransferase [Monoraphidium neglectum]|eukprot:XP_013898846.1 Serine--pyruvate aminotransferase [Monoraphidium neglectum]
MSARRGLWQLAQRAFASHAGRPGEAVPAISNAHRLAPGSSVIQVPQRLLMGPGPANADPRILAAQSLPLLGHMHPPFLKIMDEISEGLRYTLQTDSKYTLMVSGTGHAGMEAAIANLLEPGEKIIGIWGTRVADLAARYGGDVIELKADAGRSFSLEELTTALETHKPALLFLCQGESSTGVHQSLAGLGDVCKRTGTLLLVDTVCSLGGVPFFFDKWGVDCMYSGSQKCLSAPPGGAPFALSERALEKLKGRKTKPATFNLDMNLIGDYWGWFNSRSYHHTGMVSMCYALREALSIVQEEGLDNMWSRHLEMHEMLWHGLKKLGLEPFVERDADRQDPTPARTPLTRAGAGVTFCSRAPGAGVDWAAVVKNAMDKYYLEIAGGLGPTAGKVWRIGLMGYNARPQNVELVIDAFRDGLQKQGKL